MVIWSNPAKNDLKRIHDYISADSNFYAKKVIQVIIEKAKKLEDFPQLGRIVPELRDENVRELFIYSYRLIYQITQNNVDILTIIHGKRDFNKAYKDNK